MNSASVVTPHGDPWSIATKALGIGHRARGQMANDRGQKAKHLEMRDSKIYDHLLLTIRDSVTKRGTRLSQMVLAVVD